MQLNLKLQDDQQFKSDKSESRIGGRRDKTRKRSHRESSEERVLRMDKKQSYKEELERKVKSREPSYNKAVCNELKGP